MFLVLEKAAGTRPGYGTNGCTTACLKLAGTTAQRKLQAEIRQGQKQDRPPKITAKVHQELITLGITEFEWDLFILFNRRTGM